jgi:ESS family glutamate:Na+ symporter
MFLDFATMSILLLTAHLIRARLSLLQNLFVPTPVIAGLIGLVAGSQALDLIPFSKSESGGTAMSGYPGQLVVILFATLFMGGKSGPPEKKRSILSVGDTLFYNVGSFIGQYGVALAFGVGILALVYPDLHHGFAMLMPAGFVGGHGTAAVFGDACKNYDWPEGLSIAQTFATVGLISAIVGGMALVNLGARRGWTRLVSTPSKLPRDVKYGFVDEPNRASMGSETVSPMALDPLAWHLVLALCAYGIAHYLNQFICYVADSSRGLPLFAVAMLVGAAMQKSMDAVKLGGYVDRRVMSRIGSAASDYLIAFGVASIRIDVVKAYAGPLAIMCVVGIAYSVGLLWLVGRRVFRDFWFERGIFVYGWNTGIVGMGVLLLRTVDPRTHTRTLADFGVAYLVLAFVEIGLYTVMPDLVFSGRAGVTAIVLMLLAAGCIWATRFHAPDKERP